MTLSPEQIHFFHTNGYLLVPNLFTPEEIESFREGCLQDEPGDSLGRPAFRQITLSSRIIRVMEQLLGKQVVYPGLSLTRGNDPVHHKTRGARVFHTDATNDDEDFSQDFLIYNTGIYLQDHSVHSGGLKVKIGSHKFKCIVHDSLSEYFKNLFRAFIQFKFSDLRLLLTYHKSINIPSRPGDFIVFHTRTHHSGHAIRLKLAPNLSMPPILENMIPRWMALPIERSRCVILTIYAAQCRYLDGYIAKQIRKKARETHYLHSPLKRPEIVELAKRENVLLRDDGFDFYNKK